MSGQTFDFVATGRPVDATARAVLSPGVHYDPGKCATQGKHSDLPLPTKPFPGPDEHNLTGFRNGSLVVVGYSGRNAQGNGSWVVRCDCGHYETRTAKAMRNPRNTGDACTICRDLKWIRNHSNRVRETRPRVQP